MGAIVMVMLLCSISGQAQETKEKQELKTYLIERDIPNAGQLNQEELKGISKKSCSVLEIITDIEWVNNYVMDNKVYYLYRATTPELINQHAKDAGFPVTSIMEMGLVIGPKTAN